MGTDAKRDDAKRRRDLMEAQQLLQSAAVVSPSTGETADVQFPADDGNASAAPPQEQRTSLDDLYEQPLFVDPFLSSGLSQVQKKLHSLNATSPRAQMATAIQQQTTSKAPPHAAYRGSEVADEMLRERNPGASVTPTDESRAFARDGVAYVPSELLSFPEAIRPTVAAMGSQTIANHELEHATKQPAKVAADQLGSEHSPDQTAREIGPSMGDLAFRAEQFKREEGKPLDVQIELPGGIKHDAQWIADQAKQHGYFEGRSMHDLLFNTEAGQQYMKQMATREAAMNEPVKAIHSQPPSESTEPQQTETPEQAPVLTNDIRPAVDTGRMANPISSSPSEPVSLNTGPSPDPVEAYKPVKQSEFVVAAYEPSVEPRVANVPEMQPAAAAPSAPRDRTLSPPSVVPAAKSFDEPELTGPLASNDAPLGNFDLPSAPALQPVELPNIDLGAPSLDASRFSPTDIAVPVPQVATNDLAQPATSRSVRSLDGKNPEAFEPAASKPDLAPVTTPASPAPATAEPAPLPPPPGSIASQADWSALSSLPTPRHPRDGNSDSSSKGEMEQVMIAADSLADQSIQMFSRLAMLLQTLTINVSLQREQIEALQIRMDGGVMNDR